MLRLTEDDKAFLSPEDRDILTSEQQKYIRVIQNKSKSASGYLLNSHESLENDGDTKMQDS